MNKQKELELSLKMPEMDDKYYAARYEDLLLQQRILQQDIQTGTHHKDDSMNDVATLIANHAEMITMLESALKSAKAKDYWATKNIHDTNINTNEQRHLEALETLLHETWNRHMYQTDQEERLHNPSSYTSLSSLITWSALQLGNDEYQSYWNDLDNNSKRSFEHDHSSTTTTTRRDPKSLADAFFHDYPECISADFIKKYNQDNDDDDEENDDDDDWADINTNTTNTNKEIEIVDIRRPSSASPTTQKQQQQQQQQQIMGLPNTTRVSSASVAHSKYPVSTVMQPHVVKDGAFYSKGIEQRRDESISDASRPHSVPFDLNTSTFRATKEDHVIPTNTSTSNPYRAFKTAKEYSMETKNDKVNTTTNGGSYSHTQSQSYPYQKQQLQQQQKQQNFDYSTSTDMDPWGSLKPFSKRNSRPIEDDDGGYNTSNHALNPSLEDMNSTTFQRSNLSAGLKRKFQLPKPRNPGGTGSTQSYGGGSSVTSKPSSNNKSIASDGDDALPEELKGLDKELIQKIEMEIVDSGDPVSFQDIAGLAEAKQTIMELICWPMKRPDLFTGLRRVANGLLLFGPPGTGNPFYLCKYLYSKLFPYFILIHMICLPCAITGKTLIGKAIAYESGATFFSISSSSLTSKWIGMSFEIPSILRARMDSILINYRILRRGREVGTNFIRRCGV